MHRLEETELKGNMNEEKAYDKLQEMLQLAEELRQAGAYTCEELIEEIRLRLNE